MSRTPAPHAAAARLFASLSKRYTTPQAVQRYLRTLPYNREKDGETLRSAYSAARAGTAHCLEAALIAAALLEPRGYPPLVMSLESIDDLDHVVYVFEGPRGWGAIGRSRCEGLHGRAPVFRTLRDLAWSYVDPFVDETGRVTGYGVTSLDDCSARWRDSPKHVWKTEQFLIDLKHKPLKSSDARFKRALAQYRSPRGHIKQKSWW